MRNTPVECLSDLIAVLLKSISTKNSLQSLLPRIIYYFMSHTVIARYRTFVICSLNLIMHNFHKAGILAWILITNLECCLNIKSLGRSSTVSTVCSLNSFHIL